MHVPERENEIVAIERERESERERERERRLRNVLSGNNATARLTLVLRPNRSAGSRYWAD